MGKIIAAAAISLLLAIPTIGIAAPEPAPAATELATAELATAELTAYGYGIGAAIAKDTPAPGRKAAVDDCFSAIEKRLDGRRVESVTLASVNRAHLGSEGWITDLTVDVTRKKRGGFRRDFTCRAGEHGLHLARY